MAFGGAVMGRITRWFEVSATIALSCVASNSRSTILAWVDARVPRASMRQHMFMGMRTGDEDIEEFDTGPAGDEIHSTRKAVAPR
jgi:hypothetical protein